MKRMDPAFQQKLQQIMQQASQLQNTGNYKAARQLYLSVLANVPNYPPALNMLGAVSFREGKLDEAISHLKKAIKSKPDYIFAMNNLANIYRAKGKFKEAKNFYQKALKIDPNYDEALSNLGITFKGLGQLKPAENTLKKAIAKSPTNASAHNNLGVVYLDLQNLNEASKAFEKAVDLNPSYVEALNNLGYCYQASQQFERAEAKFYESLKYAPNNPNTYNNLGLMHQSNHKSDKAIENFKKAIEINPRFLNAINNLANCYNLADKYIEAKKYFEMSLELDPTSVISHNNLGATLSRMDLFEEALECHQKALEIESKNTQTLQYIASLLPRLNRTEEAIEYNEKALKIDDRIAYAYYHLGVCHQALRDEERALEHYRKALEIEPEDGYTHLKIARIKKYSDLNDDVALMEAQYAREDIDDANKAMIGFALGKIFEDFKDYEKAFPYFKTANHLRRQSYIYDTADDKISFDDMKKTFTTTFLDTHKDTGHPSQTPIFILGMPRSGTTLVEQILGSHSSVFGAGEISSMGNTINAFFPTAEQQAHYHDHLKSLDIVKYKEMGAYYLESLKTFTKGEKSEFEFVSNKLPANFKHIGLIKLILPNAKIIHCKRDPMDTCLSIYCNFFRALHTYAHDQVELAQYYHYYQDIMAHWHEVLPNFIYDVDYEKLVNNQEEETRKLLDFCNLEMEEACLNFHKSDRTVRTVSDAQVRQPIYKKSIKKWENYKDQLKPLYDSLTKCGVEI